jgi:hypothetical protein
MFVRIRSRMLPTYRSSKSVGELPILHHRKGCYHWFAPQNPKGWRGSCSQADEPSASTAQPLRRSRTNVTGTLTARPVSEANAHQRAVERSQVSGEARPGPAAWEVTERLRRYEIMPQRTAHVDRRGGHRIVRGHLCGIVLVCTHALLARGVRRGFRWCMSPLVYCCSC